MKIEIKELQHQLNIYKEIEDINIKKEDYYDYKVEEKFYNGKKINKKINSLDNFQEKIKQHCLENKIDFENLSEPEMLSLMQENLAKSKTIKQEIDDNEKNKNTIWTLLLNTILEKIDQGSFESLINKMN